MLQIEVQRPTMPLARISLVGEEGLTLHMRRDVGPWGMLCTAPCHADVPVGRLEFGLSGRRTESQGVPTLNAGPVFVPESGLNLRGEIISQHGRRVGGAVLGVMSVLLAIAGWSAAIALGDTDKGLAATLGVSGILIFLVGGLSGLAMYSSEDIAQLEVVRADEANLQQGR